MNDEQVIHAMCLDDAYQVERILAQGAGGTTELVSIHGAGPFVRKKMRTELANRRVWLALADCPCARLPRVQATYELPDRFVAVYDYVPGQTLEAVVAGRGPLPSQEAVAIALQVCEAIGALHRLDIVHRDVSPANIVVAADGAHLIDLGIARLHVANAPRDTTSLGTWGFASPEQYGFAQTDARSDIYSIGRLLGYMLTGLLPDSDGYADALLDKKLCPPRLRAVVEQACAFEPSARYQDIAELVAALGGENGKEGGPGGSAKCSGDDADTAEKTLAGESTAQRATKPAGQQKQKTQPEEPGRREKPQQRRRRAPVTVVAGAAVCLALVGAGSAALLHQAEPNASPDSTAEPAVDQAVGKAVDQAVGKAGGQTADQASNHAADSTDAANNSSAAANKTAATDDSSSMPATALSSAIGAATSNALDTMRNLKESVGTQPNDNASSSTDDAEPADEKSADAEPASAGATGTRATGTKATSTRATGTSTAGPSAGGSLASDIATMATYAAIRDTYGEEAAREFLVSQGLPEDAFADDDASDTGDASGIGGDSRTHADADADTVPTNALEIVDSCWSRAANGLIHYSVAIKNTSATQRIEYPSFQIVGRDADGSVLFADDMVLAGLEPGETQWYGSVSGSNTTPTTVEFAPIEPESWQWEHPSTASASYTIDGLRESADAFTTLFTGEVTCTHDDGVDSDDLLVTVVLRNEAGAVIYGASSILRKPVEGASIAFQINASGCPANYASIEAYAYTC